MIKLMISFVCEFDANILDISDKKSLYAPFTIHAFFCFSIFFSFFFVMCLLLFTLISINSN